MCEVRNAYSKGLLRQGHVSIVEISVNPVQWHTDDLCYDDAVEHVR